MAYPRDTLYPGDELYPSDLDEEVTTSHGYPPYYAPKIFHTRKVDDDFLLVVAAQFIKVIC